MKSIYVESSRAIAAQLSNSLRALKSRWLFLDNRTDKLPPHAAIAKHWETISTDIRIIHQDATTAASAVVDVSSGTRLWLYRNRNVAVGADGDWIGDLEMLVCVTRNMYGLERFSAFKMDHWRSIIS